MMRVTLARTISCSLGGSTAMKLVDSARSTIPPGRHGLGERVGPARQVLEAGVLEDDAPLARGLPGRFAGIAVHHSGERRDPGNAIVAHVPDQGQGAARFQHAQDLARRLRVVEPVKGRGAADEAGCAIGSGNRLGAADRHRDVRMGVDRDAGGHPRRGLNGKDALARQRQELGELARAGAEIDDRLGRRQIGRARPPDTRDAPRRTRRPSRA